MTFFSSGTWANATPRLIAIKPTIVRRRLAIDIYLNADIKILLLNISTKRETSIERFDQLVYCVLCRIQHHSRSNHIPVQAAFANEYSLAFGFFKDFQYSFRRRFFCFARSEERRV